MIRANFILSNLLLACVLILLFFVEISYFYYLFVFLVGLYHIVQKCPRCGSFAGKHPSGFWTIIPKKCYKCGYSFIKKENNNES